MKGSHVNVCILGSTGVVGRQMIKCLEEQNIMVDNLYCLASEKSAGKKIRFKNNDVIVENAATFDFRKTDFVLGAVEAEYARLYAKKITESNAVFIDNSSAFRMDEKVPLVVPEINGKDAENNSGIISNPNCTTIITLTALSAINAYSQITEIIASSYQAVSGAGLGGMEELEKQISDPLYKPSVFPRPIAMNVIPFIGSECDNFYTTEEMKLQNEGRKILHNPNLKVTCTCVRVPVIRCHSVSVTFRTKEKISVKKAEELIKANHACVLSPTYPTPLEVSDQDKVYVGRIRDDLTSENGLTLWCCGDQIRKGAATNAVQILRSILSVD